MGFIKDKINKEAIIEKNKYISISHHYTICNTNFKNEYFAFYRNKNMNLEWLKQNKINILFFVEPLKKYLNDNNIKKIYVAPHGDRFLKNGFHFITEICNLIDNIEFIHPFENIKNKINLKKEFLDYNFKDNDYILDDIVTFGSTVRRMNKLTNINNYIILIKNK